MTAIILTFIGTFFLDLSHRRILLKMQWNREIKKFNLNKETLMKIDLSGYKLSSSHIY